MTGLTHAKLLEITNEKARKFVLLATNNDYMYSMCQSHKNHIKIIFNNRVFRHDRVMLMDNSDAEYKCGSVHENITNDDFSVI